jgi:hypothetical protein
VAGPRLRVLLRLLSGRRRYFPMPNFRPGGERKLAGILVPEGLPKIRSKYNFPRLLLRPRWTCLRLSWSAERALQTGVPPFTRRFPSSQMDPVSVEKLVQGQRSL